MLSTQAPCTEVELLTLSIYSQGYRVNIGQPAPVGPVFRMADIMPELWCFSAYITFHDW